jgi:hypothetical protein
MMAAPVDLVLKHPDEPEQRFEREVARIASPRLARHADDPVELKRRAALAEIIERAHRAWAKRGGQKA